MMPLNEALERCLKENGAALVGFADLRELDEDTREGLPYGISIAVALDPDILTGIGEGPTADYHDEYKAINKKLVLLADAAANFLSDNRYRAIPLHPTVDEDKAKLSTRLPHKTVATRAGLGWIGKCALLITREYGSAIRLTTVLTDAPLVTGQPENNSHCGSCSACVDICPGGAVTGRDWQSGMPRESLYDAHACRRTARELSFKGFGEYVSICGRCIVVCPWTRKYLVNPSTSR